MTAKRPIAWIAAREPRSVVVRWLVPLVGSAIAIGGPFWLYQGLDLHAFVAALEGADPQTMPSISAARMPANRMPPRTASQSMPRVGPAMPGHRFAISPCSATAPGPTACPSLGSGSWTACSMSNEQPRGS